jgi:hypothetical protein
MMLRMTGTRRIALEDHYLDFPYGRAGPWIKVKRFRPLDGNPITADEAVEALLADPEYRDHYCSPENISAGGPLHGPYWAERISLEDFLDIAVEECESMLQAWRQIWSSEDDSAVDRANTDAVFDKALALVRQARDRRYLLNLRAEAEHDWGWVLGDFHEFVLVASDGTVWVLVASDD